MCLIFPELGIFFCPTLIGLEWTCVHFSQVSVFSPTPRKHYLNITPDNIVRIYTPNADNSARQSLVHV